MKPIKLTSWIQQLETLAVLALFFLILAAFTQRHALMYTAMVLLVTALFVKPLARLITTFWLAFSEIIGKFSSRAILSLVFYLLLTPIALLYRLFNKNPLGISPPEGRESLYAVRDHRYAKEDLEKMW